MKFVDSLIRNRFWICAVVFTLLVAGKFHGSSIGRYTKHFSAASGVHERHPLIGIARAVRADEWQFTTPTNLAQLEADPRFPLVNRNIGSTGQNMLVGLYAPVLDVSLIGKPMNWGFFLLGAERGVSWWWWSKLFLLLLLSFEIAKLFTDGNKRYAFLGSLWITLSPFVQWWFSSVFVDSLIFSMALVVLANEWMIQRNSKSRALLAVGGFIASVGFVLSLHPGFQVVLFYFIAVSLIPTAWEKRREIRASRVDLLFLGGVVLAFGMMLYHVWLEGRSTIELVRQTAYPGARRSYGGAFDLRWVQYYLLDWLTPFKRIHFQNYSEVATFVNFLPATLFVLPQLLSEKSLARARVIGLLGLIGLLLLWLTVPFPQVVSKVLLFNYVPEFRAHFLLGFCAALLSLYVLSHRKKSSSPLYTVLGCVFAAAIYLWSVCEPDFHEFLTPIGAGVAILIFTVANWALLSGRVPIFVGILALLSFLPALAVNPIDRTLGSIYHTQFANEVRAIKSRDPQGVWAGVDDWDLGPLLIALGARTYNGVHWAPDLAQWRALDPTGKYGTIYNRYGQFVCHLSEGETSFVLEDPVSIRVNLGPEGLRKSGVRYLVARGKQEKKEWLRLIGEIAEDGLYFYRVE